MQTIVVSYTYHDYETIYQVPDRTLFIEFDVIDTSPESLERHIRKLSHYDKTGLELDNDKLIISDIKILQ